MLWMKDVRRPLRGAVLTFHQPSLRSQIQRDTAHLFVTACDRAWPEWHCRKLGGADHPTGRSEEEVLLPIFVVLLLGAV